MHQPPTHGAHLLLAHSPHYYYSNGENHNRRILSDRETHTHIEIERDRETELYALVFGWMAAWEEKAPKLA